MTKYEKAVFDLVRTSHAHLTAQQIYERLRITCPRVVLATVYNNLNKLCQSGLIRRISAEGMPDRYDTTQKHDHLICRKCGKILDAALADLTAPLRGQLGEDFLYYDLKVYYLCPECRRQESAGGTASG